MELNPHIFRVTAKTQVLLGPARGLPHSTPAASSYFLFVDAALRLRDSRLWLEGLEDQFRTLSDKVFLFDLHAGENTKRLEALVPIYQHLVEHGADRNSILVAVGGGVLGDLTGFVAATYFRGVRWWGVPTTLLSQLDSSVGGKTGVNLTLPSGTGKNLIGAFHQPDWVICDPSILGTLSERDWISGLGELFKMALLFDRQWLEDLASAWRQFGTVQVVSSWISKSLIWKGRVVDQDERDLSGTRAILNFGHTFGHVFEGGSDPGTFRHGEAVILGMRAELRLSLLRGFLNESRWMELDAILAPLPVPKLPQRFCEGAVFDLFKADKKSVSEVPTFVLLRDVGAPVMDTNVSRAEIQEVMAWLCANQK